MSVDSGLLALAVFAAVVSGVFGLAAIFLWRGFRERAGRTVALGANGRRVRAVVWLLAAFGSACIAYGRFVEPFWPEVTHVTVPLAKLTRGTKPIRIVHLSDIHSDAEARIEERLPALVSSEHPDVIVFTGDSLNSPEGLPVFRACMSALAKIAPTYVVRGNWDEWWWKKLDLFGDTGAIDLSRGGMHGTDDDRRAYVEIRGTKISLTGIPVDDEAHVPTLLRTLDRANVNLLLHHFPDEIYEVAKFPVDLYLAGHTHGGQVALPVYGALVTFSKFGKRFESGLYQVNDTSLYVNRGLGMEGGPAPRVRFWARPEITVIDLVAK